MVVIDQDPDLIDERINRPREISLMGVRWETILQAVSYAISRCPTGVDALDSDSFGVELPIVALHGREVGEGCDQLVRREGASPLKVEQLRLLPLVGGQLRAPGANPGVRWS